MLCNLINKRSLFWDIDEKNIEQSLMDSGDWVIVRVFDYGDIEDIEEVIELYGVERTKKILLETNLRPMAKTMAYLFLNIDKKNEYV